MVISIACTAVQKCFPKSSLELALSCSFVIQWHKLIPNRNANIFANLGTHQIFFFWKPLWRGEDLHLRMRWRIWLLLLHSDPSISSSPPSSASTQSRLKMCSLYTHSSILSFIKEVEQLILKIQRQWGKFIKYKTKPSKQSNTIGYLAVKSTKN